MPNKPKPEVSDQAVVAACLEIAGTLHEPDEFFLEVLRNLPASDPKFKNDLIPGFVLDAYFLAPSLSIYQPDIRTIPKALFDFAKQLESNMAGFWIAFTAEPRTLNGFDRITMTELNAPDFEDVSLFVRNLKASKIKARNQEQK